MRKESVPQADDLLYRDYLVDVFESFIIKDLLSSDEFGPSLTPGQIRQKTLEELKKKLKQYFDTTDNTVVNTNSIGVEILKAVLIEDLGFQPGYIPAQEDLSDQEYLDALINLSE